MQPLSDQAVQDQLAQLDGWVLTRGQLTKEFSFKDFDEAMSFVNKVAKLAQLANHHPDIRISYNRVNLQLSTHSVGGITAKDFELARALVR
jgi:4a-hydroxytetrahydrobiopterin dehydratase